MNIIGVYRVAGREPVHLIEAEIKNCQGVLDMTAITQEIPSQPRSNWQVPYMEHLLNPQGTEILADDLQASLRPELWKGDIRLAFFFFFLDTARPLSTPFGEVRLPKETELPERLRIIKYEPPD
jgi:hypothetical protein